MIVTKVEICRHGCLDHCQLDGQISHKYAQKRKDHVQGPSILSYTSSAATTTTTTTEEEDEDASLYEDIIENVDRNTQGKSQSPLTSNVGEKSSPKAEAQTSHRLPAPIDEPQDEDSESLSQSYPFLVSISY